MSSGLETTKRANWLELFFDLVFVFAIAKATHVLVHLHDGHVAWSQYGIFVLIMIPVWWAWTGNTMFATRFDTEDTTQRLLTLAQMLAVVKMGRPVGVYPPTLKDYTKTADNY